MVGLKNLLGIKIRRRKNGAGFYFSSTGIAVCGDGDRAAKLFCGKGGFSSR
jgi:hypothetical protein